MFLYKIIVFTISLYLLTVKPAGTIWHKMGAKHSQQLNWKCVEAASFWPVLLALLVRRWARMSHDWPSETRGESIKDSRDRLWLWWWRDVDSSTLIPTRIPTFHELRPKSLAVCSNVKRWAHYSSRSCLNKQRRLLPPSLCDFYLPEESVYQTP